MNFEAFRDLPKWFSNTITFFAAYIFAIGCDFRIVCLEFAPNLRSDDFVTKIIHKKVEAEGPRLRARSHSVLSVYVFRHDFLTIFVHDFGPRFVAEISRKLKTKNGKRIQFLPKNGQSFGRKTDNKTKSGQFFGRKTDKVLAENWPNFWPKIVQKFGRKAAKSLAENRTSFLSKDGHDASPGAPPRRSNCIAMETV